MTTTTFGVASGNNANNQDMMYYLWADVPGLLVNLELTKVNLLKIL